MRRQFGDKCQCAICDATCNHLQCTLDPKSNSLEPVRLDLYAPLAAVGIQGTISPMTLRKKNFE
jgi:hypothetical protein